MAHNEGFRSPDQNINKEEGTYSKNFGQSLDIIYRDFLYLLFQYWKNKSIFTRESRRDFVQWLWNILGKPSVREVLFEIMDSRASTARVLHDKLKLSRAAIYDSLEVLIKEGVVLKTRETKTDGRPAKVYAVLDYLPEDIVNAITNDMVSRTPGYTEARRISQLILDDYFSKPEPRRPLYTKDDIFPVIKEETRGFRWFDLKDHVLSELRRAEITVYHGGR